MSIPIFSSISYSCDVVVDMMDFVPGQTWPRCKSAGTAKRRERPNEAARVVREGGIEMCIYTHLLRKLLRCCGWGLVESLLLEKKVAAGKRTLGKGIGFA